MDLIKVGKGDVVEELTARLAERGISHAAVVSIVGAVKTFTVANMKADNPRETVMTSGRLAEVSGVGEIEGGVPNLHVSCGVEGGTTFSGHLHAADVGGPYFLNVYLVRL